MLTFSLLKQVRRSYQPKRSEVAKWIKHSLVKIYNNVYVDVLIVPAKVSQELNLQYRNKNCPTNVISLEYGDSRDEYALLTGEIILCDEVIVQEAKEQAKTITEHYAHMLVHGLLHLQGFDHLTDKQAQEMESLEIKILHELGFANPYC